MAGIDKVYLSYNNWFIVRDRFMQLVDEFVEFAGYEPYIYSEPQSKRESSPFCNFDTLGDYFMLKHFFDNKEVFEQIAIKMYNIKNTAKNNVLRNLAFDIIDQIKAEIGEANLEYNEKINKLQKNYDAIRKEIENDNTGV